jgi:hypothetical protein
VIQDVSQVGLTEDEIITISFRNPRVKRLTKLGEDHISKLPLCQYEEKGKKTDAR